MTVSELANALSLKPIALPCGERTVCGVYIGDLLSWVMGRAKSDDLWITIMSNVNIVAVATLADVSCILLAEGVTPDAQTAEVARSKGVNILTAESSAYELAKMLSGII